MAPSQIHFRSISLPSRLHPINSTGFESELQKLNSFISKNAPITSETIQSGLLGLAELYTSIELYNSAQKQLTQSIALQDAKSTEESLSSSVDLLDSCSAMKELFQMIKENIQTLQSALRIKGLEHSTSSVQNDVTSYFSFRERMNRLTAKTLKSLKNLEQMKNGSLNCTNINVFRELTGVTIAIFRRVLVFLSWPTSRPSSNWALVSKLMHIKSAASENNDVANEVGNVDFALSFLQGKMKSNEATVFDVQKKLQNLESVVEGFERGLESLFRQLVQSRVTLLNILTHQN
ncbi:hypothetical protein PHJA_000840500 [Phtheirospermum japonicum]|uniref:Uncharacterized protein n=1 Tax=Phtheirospermum japonicum TaxID=374723 RepID=A0A830BHX1_9LAMI|nr:hypothetical protein PHJA_000840500 [Phtheirospermum japonicum]